MENEKRNLEREIARLLNSREWPTDTGAYLRSEEVCIAIRPYLADEAATNGRVHIPLAILPLKADVALLQGLDVSLAGPVRCTGKLNARGQAAFLNVPQGVYRAALEVAGPTEVAIKPPTLTDLIERFFKGAKALFPGQVAYAQTEQSKLKRANQDGSLEVSISKYRGQLWLNFEGDGRTWADSLALCLWQPWASREQAEDISISAPGASLYFVILETAGDKAYGSMTLAGTPAYRLHLPAKPYPVNELTPDMADILRASVRRAATGHDLSAWQKFATRPDLHPALREVIEKTAAETSNR